ncbi:hypothetical protein, partial [Halalkalibacterium halodurans]|uniref:hypothetical protein n=1 Tax=Halalkalibacterium halodurans TaxID=86665 RepID=UPI001CA99890
KGACVHFFCPLLCKNPNIYCRAFLKETSQSKAAYWIIGEDTGTLYKTPASHKRDRRFCKYIGYSIASLL